MSADNPPRIYTLPLFPLHSVLFPHFLLQLHIFEERYQVMIHGCIERNSPFGVILIRAGEEVGAPAIPYTIGCVTRIVGVQELGDGRMNLLAAGERRFRLLETMEADLPYLLGRVEELEDQPDAEADLSELTDELKAEFLRYLALLATRIGEAAPEVELPDDAELLTFCVASIAMMPVLDKQSLLEMVDTRERLETELLWLREQGSALEALPESEPPVRILTACPLDVQSDAWQRYRDETRN
jgi:Lon protease-like protein